MFVRLPGLYFRPVNDERTVLTTMPVSFLSWMHGAGRGCCSMAPGGGIFFAIAALIGIGGGGRYSATRACSAAVGERSLKRKALAATTGDGEVSASEAGVAAAVAGVAAVAVIVAVASTLDVGDSNSISIHVEAQTAGTHWL